MSKYFGSGIINRVFSGSSGNVDRYSPELEGLRQGQHGQIENSDDRESEDNDQNNSSPRR